MNIFEICFRELEDDEVYQGLDHNILCWDCHQEEENLADLGVLIDHI